MADLIPVQRDLLLGLLERSQLNIDEVHNVKLPGNVLISKAELTAFKASKREYDNLRRALLRGGVDVKMIDLLCQDDGTARTDDSVSPTRPSGTSHTTASRSSTAGTRLLSGSSSPSRDKASYSVGSVENYGGYRGYDRSHRYQSSQGSAGSQGYGESPEYGTYHGGEANEEYGVDENTTTGGISPIETSEPDKPRLERNSTRTVLLVNLAEATTHRDLIKIIRGGMVLDVFLRSHERTASISFVLAENARSFFNHLRKHDIYVKNKRLEARWSDRQFILPGHVAGAIARGATRNMIIRGCDSRHTEESIRDDLEHIHNLVVVKMEFIGKDCHVSLNSIHHSVSARSCMMSRLKYKSARIEWDVDECVQSYERVAVPKSSQATVVHREVVPVTNRFGLLSILDDEEDEISATFQSKKTVGIAA